jgi:hypothetical protein
MTAIKKPVQRVIPPPGRKLTLAEAQKKLHAKFGDAFRKLASK